MTRRLLRPDAATLPAMAGAFAIGAQFIAGRAARDALFLSWFEPTALPLMMIGTSLFAIVLVVASSKALADVSPETYVPAVCAASAALVLAIWQLVGVTPHLAASLLYLLVSGVGPLLGSGFWLIASERFDPRTAKQRFGQIGAAGTVGGLTGGLVAARLSASAGVVALLPLLAAVLAFSAWQIRRWARVPVGTARVERGLADAPSRSGVRILVETPYLRNLAALTLLVTIAAALVDYVFKAQAKASVVDAARLGTFFSLYYAGVNVVVFLLQTFGSRAVLERLGLSAATGASSLALAVGGALAMIVPGLPMVAAARGSETALRASLLSAGYELFYTPVSPRDRRAVKAVVDVAVDRTGDILGAAIVQVLLWTALANLPPILLALSVLGSLGALVLASRSSRGYVQALEQSLLERAEELDRGDVEDHQTRTALVGTLSGPLTTSSTRSRAGPTETVTLATDREMQDILALRSPDPEAVRAVLRRDTGLAPALVPHVIKRLDWDVVAEDAVHALRTVAEERVGELIDALIDPNQPFAVRRRLARVFSVCVSQRAADGLMLGLEDLRFEVRFQCGRSLAAIVGRNMHVRIDPARIFALVLREAAVSRPVWEGRRLVDAPARGDEEATALCEVVSERASRALDHVFTLLRLVLPNEPLRLAYRGLYTGDRTLRGTALEYLESVLPPEIRERLWPLLEGDLSRDRPARPREAVVQDLTRSSTSIQIALEQSRKGRGTAR